MEFSYSLTFCCKDVDEKIPHPFLSPTPPREIYSMSLPPSSLSASVPGGEIDYGGVGNWLWWGGELIMVRWGIDLRPGGELIKARQGVDHTMGSSAMLAMWLAST